MNATELSKADADAAISPLPPQDRRRLIGFGLFLLVLAAAFFRPLADLVGLALKEDLHSHVLLIPFITGYLLHIRSADLPKQYAASVLGAAILGMAGVGVLGALHFGVSGGAPWTLTSRTAASVLAFVCFVNAGAFLFLGSRWMRVAVFPMAFLLFLMPLPEPAVHWLEHSLKVASADAAAVLFNLTGIPNLREGLYFQLPGIVIEVADECSGIRSSYVLFITSTLASYLFLRSPWRRGILALSVIPLGILRNGFRILVIAFLCVEIGPEMIHSYIHRKGGPIFFALSLIPLFLLLWWLRRGEVRRARALRELKQLERI